MEQESETLIKDRYNALPEEVRKAIESLPMQEIMQNIANKNNLHLDQVGDLYTETMLIMLGAEQADDFGKNLQNVLGVDLESAKKIALDVNEQVFLAIREALKKGQETPPPVPTPDTTTKDLVATKLTETVNVPVQKMDEPKKYTADPYREPLA